MEQQQQKTGDRRRPQEDARRPRALRPQDFKPAEHFSAFIQGAADPTDWLIENYLPTTETTLLFGASHSGKTYLALDIAMSVASGKDWHGNKVKGARPVLIVPSEGRKGLKRRMLTWAYHYHNQVDGDPKIYVHSESVSLDAPHNDDRLQFLLSEIERIRPALIIFDVFSDLVPSTDENSRDFGHIINRMRQVGQRKDMAVLIIHHTGKDKTQKKVPRGSSSIYQVADNAYVLTGATLKDAQGRIFYTDMTLENTKMKEEEPPANAYFRLRKPHKEAPAPLVFSAASDLQPPGVSLASSPQTYAVLDAMVNSNGVAHSIKELSELAGVSHPAATKHAERLAAWGFVNIDQDGRSKAIKVTEEGFAAHATPHSNGVGDGSQSNTTLIGAYKAPGVGIGVAEAPLHQPDESELEAMENGWQPAPAVDEETIPEHGPMAEDIIQKLLAAVGSEK